MQEALFQVEGERVALTRGVLQALADFRWLAENPSKFPTSLYKISMLQPVLDFYHDASGYMCEGRVLPGTTAVPRNPQPQLITAATSPESTLAHPILCWAHFTADITAQLVFWGNPEGQVTNSDLELVVSMIHHACMADCFDIRKWTTLSRTENTEGLWWQRKGSAKSTSPPAHLLRLQYIHQLLHRYVPCHNFVSGVENGISNRPY